jgi:hypothetical protein
MNLRMRLAFGCYLIALLILGAFGLLYLVSPQFMPYHAVAIGTKWSDLGPSHRILIHALMKAAGAGFLGSAVAGAFVLFVPFRAGAGWARWAILIPGLIVGIPTLYASLTVKWGTPASPPWIAPLVGVILAAAGFLLSSGRAKPDTRR